MPEPVAPLPYPDTADPAAPIPDGTVPPMPSEVTSSRAQRPAVAGGWLRKMMGRAPRGAA
jgi:hypothetical protein